HLSCKLQRGRQFPSSENEHKAKSLRLKFSGHYNTERTAHGDPFSIKFGKIYCDQIPAGQRPENI
ncbi:MAG TPA: hypothetical protein PKM72_05990, partial [Nitrospirales bacterium]|nr:hypothetical protein [Nitrospirales bacterium]